MTMAPLALLPRDDTRLARVSGPVPDWSDSKFQAFIDQLIICGMMTHMCVDSTVRAAYDLGYRCVVAEDACATKNLVLNKEEISAKDIQKSFMSAFNGMFAIVKNTDDILDDLRIS
jgi:isochorismate hydrolase